MAKYPKGLEKQTVSIAFERGMQERADPRMLEDNALELALNLDFERDGVIAKRTGFIDIDTDVLGLPLYGGSIGTIRRLATRKDELLIQDDEFIWSRSAALGAWKQKDTVPRVMVDRLNVAASTPTTESVGDCAFLGSFLLVAYERLDDSTGDVGVYYSVYDIQSGAWTYVDVLVSSVGACPRVLTDSVDDFYIFFEHFSSAEIRCGTVNTSTPGTVTSPTAMATGIVTSTYALGKWDVSRVPSSGNLVGAWVDDASKDVKVRSWNAVSLATIATRTTTETLAGDVSIDGSKNIIAVAYVARNSPSVVRALVINDDATLTVAGGPTTISTSALSVDDVHVTVLSESSSQHWAFWCDQGGDGISGTLPDGSAVNNGYRETMFRAFSGTAVAGGVEHVQPNVQFAGKPFQFSSHGYIPVSSTNQMDGIVLCTWDYARTGSAKARLRPVAHFGYGEATDLARMPGTDVAWNRTGIVNNAKYWTPGTYGDGAGIFYFTTRTALEFDRTLKQLTVGKVALSAYRYDFTDDNRALSAEFGDCTYFAGGLFMRYDEQLLTEPHFVYGPRVISAVPATGSGSLTLLGTYRYKVVFEWYDGKNQRDLSQENLFFESAVTLTGTQNQIALTFLQPTLSNRQDEEADRRLTASVYRTQADGDIFYFITSFQTEGDETSHALYTDGVADTSIADNEQIYTSGEELNDDPPPASRYICTHWNRIFLVSTEKEEIHYSKPLIAGRSAQFSRAQVIPRPPGIPTGIASMDTVLVYFTDRGIWMLEGEGPAVTGQPVDAYRAFTPVSGTVGCSDPRSIVKTPVGIFFRAASGFKLFTRDFQIIDDVGFGISESSDLLPATIGSAAIVATDSAYWAVKDLSEENTLIFIYNWSVKKWTTWVIGDGTDVPQDLSVIAGFLMLASGSTVKANSRSTYGDADASGAVTYVPTFLRTAWIKLGAVQNFKRIWRMILLGRVRDRATLTVMARFNYDEGGFTILRTWTDAEVGPLDPLQLRHHLPVQKLESIQFQIFESEPTEEPALPESQGIEYHALDLEVGLKRGIFKLPATQSA